MTVRKLSEARWRVGYTAGRRARGISFPSALMLVATFVAAIAAIAAGEFPSAVSLVVIAATSAYSMGRSVPSGARVALTEEHKLLMRRVDVLSAERRFLAEQIAALADGAPAVTRAALLERADLSREVRAKLEELYRRDAEVHEQLRLARDLLAAYRIAHSGSRPRTSVRRGHFRRRGRVLAPLKLSSGLTSLAVVLAGRRRDEARLQWRDQLEGAPEDGIIVTPARRVRYSIGFVVAALHYRLSDIVAPGWRVIDWLLATHSRTDSFAALAVGGQAIYIMKAHGLDILLTEGPAWMLATAGGIVGGAMWLRKNRGIKPQEARQPAE
ncbi:hypothetical protein ACFXHD_13815 [Streptomyces hydrogenans]|uniref:hypothetical protein n=1 Tax=Streptomyces hydrogenans TaxID=1873719 RepID=UPI00367F9235